MWPIVDLDISKTENRPHPTLQIDFNLGILCRHSRWANITRFCLKRKHYFTIWEKNWWGYTVSGCLDNITWYVYEFWLQLESIPLPAGCENYQTLNESSRKYSFKSSNETVCDNSISDKNKDWQGENWYRVVDAAGSKITQTPPKGYHCGTHAPGWINGTHPANFGLTKDAKVCFNYKGDTCNWSTSIKIRNCGSYYIYHLPKTPECTLRYCTEW